MSHARPPEGGPQHAAGSPAEPVARASSSGDPADRTGESPAHERPLSLFEPVRPVEPLPDPPPRPASLFEPVVPVPDATPDSHRPGQPPQPNSLFEPPATRTAATFDSPTVFLADSAPTGTPLVGTQDATADGYQPEPPAERTMHLPPAVPPAQLEHEPPPSQQPPEPSAAETTNPLPRVPAHQPEHLTVGLPLLDLLAPEQGPPPQLGHQLQLGQPYSSQVPHPQQFQVPEQPYPAEVRYQRPARPPMQNSTKLVIGMGAGVLLLVVAGLWALRSSPDDGTDQTGGTRSNTTAPQTSAVRVVDGFQFTQNAARTDTDCAANAYGSVVDFFKATPCASLDRVLFLSNVDGRPAVVSLAMVRMPNETAAVELKKIVDTSGTGNVADLLKAGVVAPGGPAELSDAGYASTRDGDTVVIAEADFADPAVRDQGTLDRLSTAALQLAN